MRARHRWRNPDKTTRKKEKHKKETEGEERKKGEHNTTEKTPFTNTGKTKQNTNKWPGLMVLCNNRRRRD